jgi:hypothetical protein
MNSVPEAAFFAIVLVLTLIALSRELPVQYVLTVSVVTGGLSGLVCFVFKGDCWWLPLIVLNSRGLSRYALYKWRDRPYYGWWLVGLACAFSAVLAPHWRTPILALILQVAALPWLIKRRPGKDAPNIFPFLIWLLLGAFLIFNRFFAL